jgi:hypothetical protein
MYVVNLYWRLSQGQMYVHFMAVYSSGSEPRSTLTFNVSTDWAYAQKRSDSPLRTRRRVPACTHWKQLSQQAPRYNYLLRFSAYES